MTERVRVGVVGTSWWEDMMHLPCLKSHPRASVAAICGRNRTRAEELAKKYGIPRVFTDYRELIEKGGVDALVVASPDDLHYPMVMAALDEGLNVLCEKPMAYDLKQAREMRRKASSTGRTHMVMFTHRWWPHIALIKTLLEEGAIGRRHHCAIRFLYDYGRQPRYEWRFDRNRSHGALGDMGSHSIDLAQWFFGDISKVAAHLETYLERPGPEGKHLDPAWDSALLALGFENGAHGSIHSSYVPCLGNRMFELSVALHGLSGTIESTFSALTAEVTLTTEERKKPETTAFPRYVLGDAGLEAFPRMWEVFTELPVGDRLFIDCIVSGRPAAPSFSDGLEVQEIIDAAERSHRTGRWASP